MAGDVHLAVKQFGCLFLYGLYHTRVSVARIGDTNAAGEVQVAGAVHTVQVNSLSPLCHQGKDASPHGGKEGFIR